MHFIVLDTETTNDIDCPIVYDVGYQIFTMKGDLLCEHSSLSFLVFADFSQKKVKNFASLRKSSNFASDMTSHASHKNSAPGEVFEFIYDIETH